MVTSAIPGLHIVPPQSGMSLRVLGDEIIRKVSCEDTGGAYAVYKEISPLGGGAPLHVHKETDEIFYVLEGEYQVRCADQIFSAPAGAYAVLPRGVPHAFRNVADEPSVLLVTIMPGGYIRFFEEIDAYSRAGDLDEQTLFDICGRHDIELL